MIKKKWFLERRLTQDADLLRHPGGDAAVTVIRPSWIWICRGSGLHVQDVSFRVWTCNLSGGEGGGRRRLKVTYITIIHFPTAEMSAVTPTSLPPIPIFYMPPPPNRTSSGLEEVRSEALCLSWPSSLWLPIGPRGSWSALGGCPWLE